MDDKTRKALEGSIEKWATIVAGAGADGGTSNCALCKMFYHINCFDCPVAKRSGREFCYGTPYQRWIKLQMQAGNLGLSLTADTKGQKQAARDMLQYLKELHPDYQYEEAYHGA